MPPRRGPSRVGRFPHTRGEFDKVASIGMFEHVGRERLPEYFAHVLRIVRPGRRSSSTTASPRSRAAARARHGRPPRLDPSSSAGRPSARATSSIVRRARARQRGQPRRADGRLEVRDVENLREHYALTLAQWAQRLEAHRDEAIRVGGERMYRLWRIYMGIASWQFARGEFDLGQSLLQKPTGGPSTLPPTRADLYA